MLLGLTLSTAKISSQEDFSRITIHSERWAKTYADSLRYKSLIITIYPSLVQHDVALSTGLTTRTYVSCPAGTNCVRHTRDGTLFAPSLFDQANHQFYGRFCRRLMTVSLAISKDGSLSPPLPFCRLSTKQSTDVVWKAKLETAVCTASRQLLTLINRVR